MYVLRTIGTYQILIRQGITKILPIKIPHFKDLLIESFQCDHCGFKNNSVKNAGAIQEKGVRYTFNVHDVEDLSRQVVKGDQAVFRFEDVGLDMPQAQGTYTNIEGLITKTVTDLEADQPARKEADFRIFTALEHIIQQLKDMLAGKAFPIHVSLDDISGNSWIAPSTTDRGSKYIRQEYLRTHEQNVTLGLTVDETEPETNGSGMEGVDIVDDQVYELPSECPACAKPCTINAKKTKIPHFKDVIIMATVCEHCGYKTNDIKTGGEIPEKGKRITVTVKTMEDLSRDILKSETCALKSADLGLEVHAGTLGGRFTTVEGLLTQVRDQLHGQIFDVGNEDFQGGDSIPADTKAQWDAFFGKMDKALNVEMGFSLTLEDPLANSFVQLLEDNDQQVVSEEYERSEEEMEELGLNDMKVEGYENDNDQQTAEPVKS